MVQTVQRGSLRTYSAASAPLVSPNNVPAFELQGIAATTNGSPRLVRIHRLILTATTAGIARWERYSTTVTNGTPTSLTEAAYDPDNQGKNLAVARSFVGATTAGALVAKLGGAALPANGMVDVRFGVGDASPITLNGTGDFFVVSFGSAITNVEVTVEFSEQYGS